jgi:hypothetical protein
MMSSINGRHGVISQKIKFFGKESVLNMINVNNREFQNAAASLPHSARLSGKNQAGS